MTRYVFVTGGVVSSLGKGVATATLGALLQARGFRVRLRKLDPYLNVDPGTMSPLQHGEVFVTEDGAEADLDLGHYERFTDVSARRSDNVTTGRIYQTILEKERRGDYLGATIQVIPHVTDAIRDFIVFDSDCVDFMLCEIGGTVGDIESQPFLEAIRQLGNELGRERTAFVHMTLLPYVVKAGELKTKPTQHSVRDLQSLGIQPNLLVCRSQRSLRQKERDKISSLCNVAPASVIEAPDLEHVYQAPVVYHDHGLDTQIMRHFGHSDAPDPDLSRWQRVSARLRSPDGGTIRVALVGKYLDVPDAYKSLNEALQHGALAQGAGIEIVHVPAEQLDDADQKLIEVLGEVSGIVIPGGFGVRGSVGKMRCCGFAREQSIPFLGICFGMQMAVVEAARQMSGIADAHSTEIDPDTRHPVVGLMTQWQKGQGVIRRQADGDLGGSMRLGAYPARLRAGSLVARIYGASTVAERHRHRYEVNPAYVESLERSGLMFSGMSPDGCLPEIVEIPEHPWFVGVQFHPELKSRPFDPHPLFASFVGASIERGRLL